MSNLPDNMSRRDWQHVNGDEGCEGCLCGSPGEPWSYSADDEGDPTVACEHREPCGCELCACNCHREPNYLYD